MEYRWFAAADLDIPDTWRRRRALWKSQQIRIRCQSWKGRYYSSQSTSPFLADGFVDYYLYNGDVTSLRVEKFQALYDLQKDVAVPNYDLDVL